MKTSISVFKLTGKRFIGLFIALMVLLGAIQPLPVRADTEATWSVGNSTYSSFSAALSAAGSSGTVKLASDGTLSAGTYTIPSGVKVIIPYNASTNTTPGNAPSGVGNSYTAPTPFRILTMATGANIIVSSNAKLLVDGRFSAQGQGNGYNGTTTGPYGKIVMNNSSSITIQSGGELDAYGYITGPNNTSGFESGTVTALSGATVREYMQIKDFRGGTATSNMMNNSQRVFPFSQYYIQNVEVPLTLYAGAYDYVYSGIYVTFFGLQTTGAVQLFGPSGMFTIKSGYMQKTYLSAQDRLYVIVNGDVELNTIKFKMYLTVDTSKYVMPINNNMTLELASGTTTINRDSSLLAGVKVIIDKDATLKISSGKNVYLYDRDTWYAENYVISNHYWPLNYVAARNGAPVSRTISTGEIDNNGLIDIQGSMFSTSEKTKVTSSEKTGRVKFTAAAPADGTTYQAVQTGSDISYSSISVTSLLLTNGDSSSTVTKGSAAGTEYFYCGLHDKWEKTPSHTLAFDPNGGSGSAYSLQVCQSEDQLPSNEFTREGYSFDGWNTKADGSGTAYADKGNITVTADTTLYAQWKQHTHTYEVVKWNWTGYTSATVDVRCTADSSHTDTLTATVTEELISSPNCIETGQKKYIATATYGEQTFTDSKTETLPAVGHSWQFVNFTWNGYSSAVGNYVCQNDQSHTQQIAATISKTTPQQPGCETAGYNEYTALINAADSPDDSEHRETVREDLPELGHDWGQWQVTNQATCLETGLRTRYCQRCSEHQNEVIPMLEHSWSDPEYVWADDNSSVTASRTCSTGNHTETETVNTVSTVTKQATCEEKGETTYTATFTNAAFTAQSKTVADTNPLGHSWGEPTYTWSEDHGSVTAVRTCSRDGSHVERETVSATAEITKQPNCEEKGETTYTAVFTNPAFSTQTETIKNIEATGHTSAEAVKENETAATCTEDGGYDLVTYCSVCQKELSREHVTEKALGHSWSEWTVTKEPTCSEPGERIRTCTRCNLEEKQTIAALEHALELVPGYEATCTDDGRKDYYQCSVCHNRYFDVEGKDPVEADEDLVIKSLGHNWSEWTVTKEATCTEAGEKERICSRCNEKEVEVIEVLGHTPTDEVKENNVEATCTEEGSYDLIVYCTRCHEQLSREHVKVPATGHVAGETVIENVHAPTCTSAGTHEEVIYCTVCGTTLSRKMVSDPAIGHDWNEPTYSWVDDYSTVTATRTCKNGNHPETETVVAVGTVTKPATCEEKGETTYTAEFSNTVFAKQTKTVANIEALGHKANELVRENEVAATCTEAGSYEEVVYCSVCNKELSRTTVVTEALGHAFGEWKVTKEATCTEVGTETRTCSRCDISETKEMPALGHTLELVPGKAATCTEAGIKDYYECSRCHNKFFDAEGKTEVEKEEDLVIAALGHDYGEWKQTKTPTCTEKGMEERECSRCHKKETREVAVLGHTPGEETKENIVDATCTEKGSYDLVVRCMVCNEILSTEHFEDAALGHDWNEPEYVWSEDNKTVTATRTCKRDKSHVESETAEVKTEIIEATCEEDGKIIYTVEFANEAFKQQRKEVTGEKALGHDWKFDGFTWNSDYSAAEGRFVCTRDNNHVEIITAEIATESFGAETDVTASIIGPDGKVYSETRKVVESDDVIRVFGPNRYYTSIKTARYLAEVKGTEKFDRIVITTGENFADALAGSYLANNYGAPVILMPAVDKAAYKDVVAYINDSISENGKVYVLGGTSAIPEERLSSVNRKIERIQGANRYITNINILKKAGYSGGEILVCTGNDFADSLSASAVNMPILLVKDQLIDEQKAYLKQFSDIRFTIIGGTSAVSNEVEKELAEYGTVVERIAGSNRFATSAEIAKRFFPEASQAVLAYGRTFPDGLSGGPLAFTLKAPLLLAESADNNIVEATTYCAERTISSGTVLGGSKLIEDGFVRKIFKLDDNVVISEFE